LSKANVDSSHHLLAFDAWLAHEFKRTGGFSALIILVAICDLKITPLRSTYLHVIGDETNWADVVQLLASAGVPWDGVLFESVSGPEGGPIDDATARLRLRILEAKIGDDRLAFNDAHFFDRWGRRMKVEEVQS
jgi:hypothetical protein